MNRAVCALLVLAFALLMMAGCAAEHRDAADARPGADGTHEQLSDEPVSPPDATPAIAAPDDAFPNHDPDPSRDPPSGSEPGGAPSAVVEPGRIGPPDPTPPIAPDDLPEPALPEVQAYRSLQPSVRTQPLEVPAPLSADAPDALAPTLRHFNPIRDEAGLLAARLQPEAGIVQEAPTVQMPKSTAIPLLPGEFAPEEITHPESEPVIGMPQATLEEPSLAPSPEIVIRPKPGDRLLGEPVPRVPLETAPATSPEPPVAFRQAEPSPASPEPAPAPALSPEPEAEEPYTVVKVFYGTDRNAVAVSGRRQPQLPGWTALTACAATTALLLGLAVLRVRHNRVLRWCAVAGLAATVLLGGFTLFLSLHGRPPATVESESGTASEQTSPAVTKVAYGNQRGTLEYGTCKVSIPKEHKVGQLEAPSIFRLEFRETPERHVVLMGVEPLESGVFFGALKARVEESEAKSAFVFVHGFNVTFEDAARRTAQIAYDLKFDGAPIFYSWPSQGGLFKYTIDETNVMWTVPHLREFLTDVAGRTGARRIHLVAHSMGNRALTSALRDLSFLPEDRRPRFKEVVLTAPDIDAEVFRKDIAPYIVQTADRVTLYASSNDTALAYSKTVHGYPRAGDSGRELLVLPDVETVDVSEVDTSLLGHSYYGSNETVLADLIEVLHKSLPAQQRRWLRPVQVGTLEYWVFQR